MMIDTGYSVNIIDELTYSIMYSLLYLKPINIPIRTYSNSNQLRTLGEFQDKLKTQHSISEATFTVLADNCGFSLG